MGIQATLRALADPTRREILNLLKHGKKSAGEITQAFFHHCRRHFPASVCIEGGGSDSRSAGGKIHFL